MKEFGETHYTCHSLPTHTPLPPIQTAIHAPIPKGKRGEGHMYHQSQIGSDSVGLKGSLYLVPDLTAAGESESGEDGDDGEEAEHRGSVV